MTAPASAIVLALVLATPALADENRPPILRDVGIDQRLGTALAPELSFRDEAGQAVRLGDYFGKPLVLSLVYFGCPMLCGQVLNGLAGSLRALSFEAGKDFDVVVVSFDPKDGPAEASRRKTEVVQRYARPGAAAGWHFLTADQATIAQLTAAVGFRYAWDDPNQQFAHAAGIVLLTPQGRVSRYLYGVDYAPRDLRLGLVEASENHIGSVVDQLLLFCFHWDPSTGKYTPLVMNTVRAAGVATLLALGGFLLVMRRREGPAS